MKIKSQLVISMFFFALALIVIAYSAAITSIAVSQLSDQQDIAENIQNETGLLNHYSTNYFLQQEARQITQWQEEYSSIVNNVKSIKPSNSEQQILLDKIESDIQKLRPAFEDVVVYLQNAPRNQSVRILPDFQVLWGDLADQNEALLADSVLLSQAMGNQADLLKTENSVLIVALLCAFGAYFITNYLIMYRRGFKSIAKLQAGTKIVGEGNLDYVIQTNGRDELEDLSTTFNSMTKNLKNLTTSKKELEMEIEERKKVEELLHRALEESKRRQAEVSALLTASKTVLQNREFKSSARVIFDSCKELLGASSGYIALLSDDGKDNIVLFLESGGLPCTVDPSLPMPIRGLRAETYASGKVAYENNFLSGQWNALLPSGHMELKNVLFAPLKVDSKTVGIMGLANKPDGFTEKDAELCLAFSDIASIALINNSMIEMLEENQSKLKDYSDNLEKIVAEKTNQLKNSERLAAIGATAGMVGHDIRNPLQAITSDVYLLKSALNTLDDENGKDFEESLKGIEENVDYVNKIVLDLQDFARPIKPFVRETDLEDLCEIVLFKSGLPENIEASCQVETKVRRIDTDPELLRRVLTNLRNNAIQAMPNGGKLELHAFKEDSSVVVTVKDTGIGIPQELRPNLFTPLFTTKSKGQGFGLAVVKRLTEALGGCVSLESEVGQGTKFVIRIPLKTQNE